MINDPTIPARTDLRANAGSKCSMASGNMSINAVVSMTPAAKLTRRYIVFCEKRDLWNSVTSPTKLIRLTTTFATIICPNTLIL